MHQSTNCLTCTRADRVFLPACLLNLCEIDRDMHAGAAQPATREEVVKQFCIAVRSVVDAEKSWQQGSVLNNG